jgi:ribose transport system substrate-binding protein
MQLRKFAAALVMAAFSASALAQVATGDTSPAKIALSNNYAGNSWRQQMLKSWANVADPAVKQKIVAAAPSFTTAESQATEQVQQIQNLILQGYKAIAVDAVSPTALNGIIKQACAAGVTVVSFDGIATEPCAYRIAVDFQGMGRMQVDYLAKRLNGKGNLLEIRGLAGV